MRFPGMVATLVATLSAGHAAAADTTYSGARSVRVTSPTSMRASVLDGAMRRTVTLSANKVSVVEDLPPGRPAYLEALGVTSSLLPYVVAREVVAHVAPRAPTGMAARSGP